MDLLQGYGSDDGGDHDEKSDEAAAATPLARVRTFAHVEGNWPSLIYISRCVPRAVSLPLSTVDVSSRVATEILVLWCCGGGLWPVPTCDPACCVCMCVVCVCACAFVCVCVSTLCVCLSASCFRADCAPPLLAQCRRWASRVSALRT